ncbi:MAG: MoaD/ThiS family protein [Chitinophagaceae bacterium]|jgi:molybdopterin converting factor small subunit|nr:MoaD/ThiS family protein [Chitinophagaceae bacterium]
MEILFFGQLTDLTGTDRVEVQGAADTETLKKVLTEKYPGLQGARYSLAVDKKIVHEAAVLSGQEVVALMPPFSGG